ncbi:hypothetical protein O4J56_18065 [Nocardiopsis sp. RSe5-2]|uniref:ABM domain-containing protein n=1 Tax=Nocardiopsis endophytica TaxID=3018445 RepID=A0ABT4U827_9ACTN|nr:hypothetical protein [Nocardiopsis endophytica]MDA2812555.1 hypothetical protein [Nocardiopsis endophytica]
MHAMIRRYRMGAGTIEELMRTVDRRFADRAQAALGILGYQAIALDERTVMTITLFATEEHLRAAEPAAERIREGLADFRVEALDADSGPVMVARGSAELADPVRPAP